MVHFDAWRGYAGLVEVRHAKDYALNHAANEFVRGRRKSKGSKLLEICQPHSPSSAGRSGRKNCCCAATT
jgi:hypothetical protein